MRKILRRKSKSFWNRSTLDRAANKPYLLQRYLGLETELFRRLPVRTGYSSLSDFESVLLSLQRQLPIARSEHPLRWFLANGSSISLELGATVDATQALFEVATPETFSPRELVAYQLANEQLLAETQSGNSEFSPGPWVKASFDAAGHILGQHESYDMRIAKGGWLMLWWIGLLAILPLLLLYRTTSLAWLAICFGIKKASAELQRITRELLQKNPVDPPRSPTNAIGANDFNQHSRAAPEAQEPSSPTDLTGWNFLWGIEWNAIEWMRVAAGLRILHAPLVFYFGLLINLVALRPHRRKLSAFLASRCILDGAGYLDDESKFWVSLRAASVDRMIGFGSYNKHRPLFRCDPMLRALLDAPAWSFSEYLGLFRPTQRVELSIGDSGMCQQAQWLRFGTTALMLDWVEQSSANQAIELRSIVQAIQGFARDWMLVRSAPDKLGNEYKAKEVSRHYLRTLKRWLEQQSDVPREAWEIIEQWQTTLNQLVLSPSNLHGGSNSELPMTLVGRLDWVSKLWLLQQFTPQNPPETHLSPSTSELEPTKPQDENRVSRNIRKKIDLRYHELSPQGYYRQLEATLETAPVLSERELSRARRSPPSGSSAWRRGSLIRELQGTDPQSDLVVDWHKARYRLEGQEYHVKFKP